MELGTWQYTAESLWHHLKRMGLSESDEKHPVLGNIKQAVDLLVQQRSVDPVLYYWELHLRNCKVI